MNANFSFKLALASLILAFGTCTLAQPPTPIANSGGKPKPPTTRSLKPPLGDYVPCLFDDSQGYDLRAKPSDDSDSPLPSEEIDEIIASIPGVVASVDPKKKVAAAATGTALNNSLQGLEKTLSILPPSQFSSLVQQLAKTAGLTADQLNQLTAFLQPLTSQGTYKRPTDVSCSFSVLQWNETKDVFGRRVSNDYVALEVNLRNLNTQNEFLVHDIQIAVDTGLSSYQFGRFQASRDKQIVRGVVQRGQTEDRRNLILNSLTAAGAILSPVSAAVADASGSLGVGVSIFQGPFLAGALSVFPDHTVEYLNNLNDRGFSPSSTNKTVVPVQGSVPLVTFLAEKPLEQLPFVHCGDPIAKGKTQANDSSPASEQSNEQLNCQLHPAYKHRDVSYDATLTGQFQPALPFKKWKPAALNIFAHRVFVVVGGVHIQQLSSDPAVTKMSCPVASDLSIDLSKADTSGNISCTLSGTNLDQVASINLEQGSATPIPGTATPDASGDSATIGFNASTFKNINGSYELFLTTKSAKDIDAKQALTFKVLAAAATPTLTPASGAISAGQTVTIADATTGATIYYTTDGTAPTSPITGTTKQYTGGIPVTAPETITAIASATGFSQSAVATGAYTLAIAQAPTVTTNAATNLSTAGATLNGSVTANNSTTQYWFAYGLSAAALNSKTSKTGALTGTSANSVNAAVARLTTKTKYYFQLVASNATGTTSGKVLTFTTQ